MVIIITLIINNSNINEENNSKIYNNNKTLILLIVTVITILKIGNNIGKKEIKLFSVFKQIVISALIIKKIPNTKENYKLLTKITTNIDHLKCC